MAEEAGVRGYQEKKKNEVLKLIEEYLSYKYSTNWGSEDYKRVAPLFSLKKPNRTEIIRNILMIFKKILDKYYGYGYWKDRGEHHRSLEAYINIYMPELNVSNKEPICRNLYERYSWCKSVRGCWAAWRKNKLSERCNWNTLSGEFSSRQKELEKAGYPRSEGGSLKEEERGNEATTSPHTEKCTYKNCYYSTCFQSNLVPIPRGRVEGCDGDIYINYPANWKVGKGENNIEYFGVEKVKIRRYINYFEGGVVPTSYPYAFRDTSKLRKGVQRPIVEGKNMFLHSGGCRSSKVCRKSGACRMKEKGIFIRSYRDIISQFDEYSHYFTYWE